MRLQLNNLFRKLSSLLNTQRFAPMDEVTGKQDSHKVQNIINASRSFIIKLKKDLGANFYIINKDEIIIEFFNIKFYFETREDLFIVNEVFNEMIYNFQINKQLVLIDIGMNIGVSAMFFLQKPNISKIYGFEPVPNTYNKLLKNLDLNHCRDKVIIQNFGLGKNDRNDTFLFSEEYKGSVGLFGLNKYKQDNSKSLEKINVEIKDAFIQISNIVKQHPHIDIFLKIDCEGGEYEILPRLYETGLLNSIKYIVMEWHGMQFLNQIQIFNNYSIYYHKISSETGMLYASRDIS